MLQVLWSIFPIFLLIVLGNLLRRKGIPTVEFWNVNDKLVYWILFPSLLFYKTSTAEISGDLAGPLAATLLAGMLAATAFSLLAGKAMGYAPPVASTIFQGAARHNTFIALAIAERLYGAEGLVLAALATAILVPPTNIVAVVLLNVLHPNSNEQGLLHTLARDTARNPLILSVLAGMAFNLSDVGTVPVLHDTTGLLGRAALPIVLLATGANLHLTAMRTRPAPLTVACLGKFVVFPAAALGVALALGLSGLPLLIITIYSVMPTAASTFTVARQMGGDAPLAAAISTLQTLLSLVTVPLSILAVQALFPS